MQDLLEIRTSEACRSHQEKYVDKQIEVERRESIELYFIELLHKYLNWWNDSCVEQESATTKKVTLPVTMHQIMLTHTAGLRNQQH